MTEQDGKLIRLGGLWKQRSQNGKWYLSGKFGQAQVLIFPVSEKRSDKSPDFVLMIGEARKAEDDADREQRPFDDDGDREPPRTSGRW